MRSRRLIGFLLAIALGVAAGLWIGWSFFAPSNSNNAPQSLRSDFQTDVVLMIAEVYEADNDLNAARTQLDLLESEDYLRTVQQAIVNAQSLGYSSTDIKALANLAQGLQLPTYAAPTEQP